MDANLRIHNEHILESIVYIHSKDLTFHISSQWRTVTTVMLSLCYVYYLASWWWRHGSSWSWSGSRSRGRSWRWWERWCSTRLAERRVEGCHTRPCFRTMSDIVIPTSACDWLCPLKTHQWEWSTQRWCMPADSSWVAPRSCRNLFQRTQWKGRACPYIDTSKGKKE